MKVGYARVSTREQNLDRQVARLRELGCDRIVCEKESGLVDERPALEALLGELGEGDVLIVVELDRASRTVEGFLRIVARLQAVGAGVVCLTPAIDTRDEFGRLIAVVFAAFAEYQTRVAKSRQRAGIEQAKARGVHMGRPSKMTSEARKAARVMVKEGQSASQIAALFGVHPSTIRRLIGRSKR